MRKIASLLTVSMFCCTLAFGQAREVRGTVRDASGAPVPFATVTEAGTRNAVTADANGNFTIRVPENARLTISSTGFTASTVAVSNAANVRLERGTSPVLDEVVVTALGLRRKPQEIGYATSTVRPDQITASRATNLGQALSGKVSGLQVQNTSSSVNGTPRLILRGLRSLTGDNNALVVLDGVQVPASTINLINPNDVERVDVLKGGQASTLYGSEGVNGAIVITTKKGSGAAKPEITLSYSGNAEEVAYLPKFQHSFGNGSGYGSNMAENFNPAENQQYGDRYNGQLRALGRTLADGSFLLTPYSEIPGGRMAYWDKGYTNQTDFSFRSGDQNGNILLSFQNLTSRGVVPGDKYTRNNIRFSSGRIAGKWNTGFDANYAWDKADRTNTDYYFFALNTAGWAPVDILKNWQDNKFANMGNYYNDFYNSPWWQKDNIRFYTRNQNLNASARAQFNLNKEINLNARVTVNLINGTTTTNSNKYTFTSYQGSSAYFSGFNNNYDAFFGRGRTVARTQLVGGIGESQTTTTRVTGDLFAAYNKNFGNVSIKAIVGGQAFAQRQKSIGASTTGIGIEAAVSPAAYNLSNSATGLYAGSNSLFERRKIGGYVDLTTGWKNFVYLHGAFRNDYTSLFNDPELDNYKKPTFQTYGGDVSIILTEAFPSIKNKVLENFKLRASYNRNGNDNISPYNLRATFPNAAGFPYSGLAGSTVSGTLPDAKLTPEIVKTGEIGAEVSLFRNRILLEASYYTQRSEAQVLDAQISSTTGYQTLRLNAADLKNQGYEIDVKAQAFKNRDWSINLNANYSHNTNEVVALNGATDFIQYTSTAVNQSALVAQKGQMFPYLRTNNWVRDPQGRVVVDSASGWPIRSTVQQGRGTTMPVHVLGLGVNVSWKNFTVVANAEYRGGHIVYHQIGEDMSFTGTSAQTALYDREAFVWPNSVYQDASGKYVPNTNIATDSWYAIYYGLGDYSNANSIPNQGEMFWSNGAFWKIRDLNVSYDLPKSITNRLKVLRGVTISAFARNLVTWLPKDNYYTDPELSSGGNNSNAQGINNSLNTPPTRQYGGSIKFVF